MRSKTLLLCFCFFAITSQAQDSSFQLKDYKYRTPGFKALSVNVSFSANVTDSKADTLTKSKWRHVFFTLPSNSTIPGLSALKKECTILILILHLTCSSYFTEANGNRKSQRIFIYSFTGIATTVSTKKINGFLRSATGSTMSFLKTGAIRTLCLQTKWYTSPGKHRNAGFWQRKN